MDKAASVDITTYKHRKTDIRKQVSLAIHNAMEANYGKLLMLESWKLQV